jgi:uncharacterized Tic20 family protein
MSVPPNDVTAPPPPPAAGAPTAEEKQWALFAHLSALAGAMLTGLWFGFGCFLGPLIIWLIKKDTMPFVNDQGKEALNFNITLAIVCIALLVLTVMTLGIGILLAFPIGVVVGVGWLVLTVIAAIKASEGVAYRYPFALRLIK